MNNIHVVSPIFVSPISYSTHVSGGVETKVKSEHKYKIEINIYDTGHSKLSLVKNLKSITGFGLKESKEIVDSLSISPQKIVVPLTASEIERTKFDLSQTGCSFDMSDISKVRDIKLIQLGLYDDKEQIVDEIVDVDIFSIFANKDNFEYIKSLLKSRYSLISEDDLLNILNNQING